MAEKKIKIASNKEQAAETSPKDNTDETSGLGNVVIRNEFYRDGYRNLLRLAVLQSLIILGLVGAMYFVVQVHQPENRYFAFPQLLWGVNVLCNQRILNS